MAYVDIDQLRERYLFHAEMKAEEEIEQIIRELKKYGETRTHAKWIHKQTDSFYQIIGQCSNCKERYRVTNFCPNCGAKMGIEVEK